MPKATNILALLVLTVISLSGCTNDNEVSLPPDPIKAIKYLKVISNHNALERKLSGYLRASDLSVLSFQLPGQIRELSVKAGDRVKRGQSLAKLDSAPYKLRLLQAQAELASASAQHKERRENHERQKLVFDKKFISKNYLDKSEADYEKASGAVRLAEAKVALAKIDLMNSELKAPFDGVITRRDVEEFEEVSGAQPIMEIQGIKGLEVDFLIPSTLLNFVTKGGAIQVRVPAVSNEKFVASVSELGVQADVRGAFPIRAVIENPGNNIRSGMVADVFVEINSKSPSILLPESAVIISDDGGSQVFIYNSETHKVHPRNVQTLTVDVDTLQVISGINDGEIVCVAGVEFLRDGQVVSLYSPNI
jgi:membrane fusion protein, multidrug efflux system